MSLRSPWLMWVLGTALYCYGFFQRVAPGVMVGELMHDLALSAAALGNLSAIYFYVYAALQMPAGLLLDRYGARLLLAVACALAAAGSAAFALAPNATAAYAGRFLVGLGASFGWVGALKVVADWFPPQRFALLTGLSLTLGLAAGLMAQAPLAAAVDSFGWRAMMIVAAIVGAAMALAIYSVLRDRHSAKPAAAASTGAFAGLARVVATPQSWIIGLQGMTGNAAINGFIGLWGVPFLVSVYGLDRATAAWTSSLVLVGWAVGCPAAGWLSDRIARRRAPLIVGSAISTLSLGAVVLLAPLPLALVWLLLALYGLSTGVTVVAYAASRDIQPPAATGAAIGFANMVAIAGVAVLQFGTGLVLDLAWDGTEHDGVRQYSADAYRTALALYPLLLAAGHALAYLVREPRTA